MSGGRKIIEPDALQQINRGYAVASVRYSFSPWKQWPTQIYEIKAAIRWFRKHAEDFNLDSEHFIAWGVSAGGHLANVVGCLSGTKELEGKLSSVDFSTEVQGVGFWYGFSDFSQMGENVFFYDVDQHRHFIVSQGECQ